MEKTIQEKLFEIEKQHHIQILYACESGSRAWGFPSPDSDYDVRFIYLRSLEHYLSVWQKADQLSFPITDELDVYGWDLSKVLLLIGKSNTTPFEWLQSPVIYRMDENFRDELWNICQRYFCARSNVHHYLGIANGAMQSMEGDNIKIKKLFYILRPLLSALWCADKKSIAPMNIVPLMQLLPGYIYKTVLSLIELKLGAAEGYVIEIDDKLKAWIDETYRYCVEKSDALPKEQLDINIADAFFRKMILR